MPRISRVTLALLLVARVTPLRAQVLHDHDFGGMLGVVFSKATGSDAVGSKVATGIAVGGFLTLGFTRGLALEPQALMVEKGLKTEEQGVTSTLKLTYIQVPVLVKLRIPIGSNPDNAGYAFVGPALAGRVGCRLSLKQADVSTNAGCEEAADQIKTLDPSVVFGLGADLGRATFSVRYDMGLSSIDSSTDPGDVKNSAILLLAGVRTRLNP